jgi:hypothetical protein
LLSKSAEEKANHRESTKREKDSVQTLRKSFLRQRSQLGRKQTAVKARAKATEDTWVVS